MTVSTGTTGKGAGSEERARALSLGTRRSDLDRVAHSGRAAMRERLRATLIICLSMLTLAMAACAPGQPTAHAPTATPQPSPTAPVTPSATAIPRLVYQADWSHGMGGWIATPGWTVSGGVLQSDLGSDRQLTSPFQPATPDYAVEFRLQIVSVSQVPPNQYDLSVDPTTGVDGFTALYDHVTTNYSMFANHPHEMIYINPMVDMDMNTFQPHDIELGTRVRTYRVEVRGPEATLLLDGRIASWARSTKTSRLAMGPIRFSCTGVEVRLSNFKVYAL